MAKFGDLMSCGSKMHPVSFTNPHHDIPDLVNHGDGLKIQKFKYLENGSQLFYKIKKLLARASGDTFWEVIVLQPRLPLIALKLTFENIEEYTSWVDGITSAYLQDAQFTPDTSI